MGVTLGKGMRRIVQSVGAVFALLAFVLLLLSITTSYWITIEVNRSAPARTVLAEHSRHRGLYRECWVDAEESGLTTVIQKNEFHSSDSCLSVDLGVKHKRNDVIYSDEYRARKGLLIAMWTVIGVAIFSVFVAIILYLYTLCQHINNYQWKHGTKAAAGLMMAAVFLTALAMSLFHGAEYLEINVMTDPSGRQAPYTLYFPSDLSEELLLQTTRSYSWSYALSWFSLTCQLLSSVLFMIVSCCYVKSKKKSVYAKPVPKKTTVVVGARNPAYDVVHERVVVAPPQVYVVDGGDYYGSSTRSSRSYDPYPNGTLQSGHSPNSAYNAGWTVQ